MEKQKLLSEQARLADQGAAEMVLMYISASSGKKSDMVIATIELGISILRGGNVDVQAVSTHCYHIHYIANGYFYFFYFFYFIYFLFLSSY